ncbi:MAG: DUF4434 domain-containing protein [Bacteroidota bacterium]|nr:DUF4434 domain-containing protein [Candidatus Kapabacteria bacterium]MDW8219340.1 DUF4434 domain-containing protein [Bacteroidota bacterium]
MRITGTFLDEISHDIPHQNWSEAEWAQDFKVMRHIGIDTAIVIRCGYRRWVTYPSAVLQREEHSYVPSTDLIAMFLKLAEQHDMKLFFGTYDSGRFWSDERYWTTSAFQRDIEVNMKVIEEAWKRYGSSPAFGGWYLSLEVSRRVGSIIQVFARLGNHCKDVSGGLPVLISPYIDGVKAVSQYSPTLSKPESIGLQEHERTWNEILHGIQGAVDILAFQDGHVEYHELEEYLRLNKQLADRYSMRSWTNVESFDRDMPIKFLPIKWEKLRLKLEAAQAAGIEKAITFEFSHFMSPHSAYIQAHHLYRRYCEYAHIPPT